MILTLDSKKIHAIYLIKNRNVILLSFWNRQYAILVFIYSFIYYSQLLISLSTAQRYVHYRIQIPHPLLEKSATFL